MNLQIRAYNSHRRPLLREKNQKDKQLWSRNCLPLLMLDRQSKVLWTSRARSYCHPSFCRTRICLIEFPHSATTWTQRSSERRSKCDLGPNPAPIVETKSRETMMRSACQGCSSFSADIHSPRTTRVSEVTSPHLLMLQTKLASYSSTTTRSALLPRSASFTSMATIATRR